MPVEDLQTNARARDLYGHGLSGRSLASAGGALLAISILVGSEFAPSSAAS
jgi:hypothetical protein